MAGKRQAADLPCTGVQDMKQNSLTLLDPDGFTSPEHPAVDRKPFVADFKTLGLLLRIFIRTLSDLLQFGNRLARQKIHCHVTAPA